MRKAGGIIALIAGVFSVIAALFTLMVGGASKAFENQNADTVIWLGWGGVAFSFLVIVLGAVAIGSKSRWPGALLMISSVAGAILGGTFVALFMVLAFVGGLLAAIGRSAVPATAAAGICLGLIELMSGDAMAQSKSIDIIDFLVDREDLVGQAITVTGCKFGAASDTSVLCSAPKGQGSLPIDSKTMGKEDLRKALRECPGYVATDACAGTVTGTITKGPFGFRMTKAAIAWRPST